MIDSARSDGVDVSLDTYPYLPGCTTLAALLPSWASSGGPSETLRRLEDEVLREKMRIAVEVTGCDGGHGIPTNWEEIQVRLAQRKAGNIFLIDDRSDQQIIRIWQTILVEESRKSLRALVSLLSKCFSRFYKKTAWLLAASCIWETRRTSRLYYSTRPILLEVTPFYMGSRRIHGLMVLFRDSLVCENSWISS